MINNAEFDLLSNIKQKQYDKWPKIYQELATVRHDGTCYRLSFEGKDLSSSDYIDMRGLDLGGVVFRDANLTNVELTGADLIMADLSGADLSGAYLDNAKLYSAKLSNAPS